MIVRILFWEDTGQDKKSLRLYIRRVPIFLIHERNFCSEGNIRNRIVDLGRRILFKKVGQILIMKSIITYLENEETKKNILSILQENLSLYQGINTEGKIQS